MDTQIGILNDSKVHTQEQSYLGSGTIGLEGKTSGTTGGRSAVLVALSAALFVAVRESDHDAAKSITETLAALNIDERPPAPVLRLVAARAKLGGAS